MPFRPLSLAFLLLATRAVAQPVPTALPFLEIAPSPAVLGLGGADVAHTNGGAYAAVGNPALVALAARDVMAATAGGPGAGDWRAFADIRFSGGAQSFGLDGGTIGLPVDVGAAAAWTTMHYGDQRVADTGATYEPADRFASLSLGASTRGAVRAALGATVRHLSTTDRVTVTDGLPSVSRRRAVTADFGVAGSADLAALAGRPAVSLPLLGTLTPRLQVTAGYSQSHVGGTMRYTGGEAMALPRTARLGWSALGGLDLPAGGGTIRVAEAEFTAQAESRLVRDEGDGRYAYAPLLGDTGIYEALAGSGDDGVTGRRGVRLAVLETVSFSRGWFGGAGFENTASRALELRASGPLKMLARLVGDGRLAAAATRLDLRWTHAVTFVGTPYQTSIDGFSLIVRP